jgi:hypothetical protein
MAAEAPAPSADAAPPNGAAAAAAAPSTAAAPAVANSVVRAGAQSSVRGPNAFLYSLIVRQLQDDGLDALAKAVGDATGASTLLRCRRRNGLVSFF